MQKAIRNLCDWITKEIVFDKTVVVGANAASTASYVLVGKILTFLMTGVALVVVTRLLGPSQYGIYTLAVAFAGIFGTAGYLGIGTALTKFISEAMQRKDRKEINKIVSNSLLIVIVSGAVLTAIAFLISGLISSYIFHSSSFSYVIEIVSFYIITSMLFGAIYETMIGFGQSKDIAIITGVEALLQAGISIGLAFDGFGALAPIFGLIIGSFIGFAFGIFLVFRRNRISLCMPSFGYISKTVNFSFPVAMSNMASNLLGTFGIVFLGFFVVPSIIGNLGVATRASTLLSMIFDSITFALLPAFSAALVNSKLKGEVGRLYGYVVYMAIALVSPLLFYMAVFSREFAALVFGAGYSYAPAYISIMSMGLLIGAAGIYASTLLISANKVRLVFKYNAAVSVLVLLLFLFLVPRFGVWAYVGIAFILSPIISDILFVREISAMFSVKLRYGKFARILLADVLVSAVALLAHIFFGGILMLAAAALVFVLLYPPLVTLLGGADAGDIETIKKLSKNIPFIGRLMAAVLNYAAMGVR